MTVYKPHEFAKLLGVTVKTLQHKVMPNTEPNTMNTYVTNAVLRQTAIKMLFSIY